jgi:hypothetical protein
MSMAALSECIELLGTAIEKYEQAKAKEHSTMIRSRQIAEEYGLQMKIGDVEYQGVAAKLFFIILPMSESIFVNLSRRWLPSLRSRSK